MARRHLLLVPVLLLLLAARAPADARPALERDLVYARVGATELKLDLHRPARATGTEPLIVWIHGGGWRRGSKRSCPLRWMTEHGYVVASIQYRLSGAARWPAQIHDCKGAVRWLRANAERLGFDATRVGVGGSSAGGHLAALLGTSGGVAALEGTVGGNAERSSRVQAVYDRFGPADFASMGAGGGAVAQLFGGTPAEKPAAARAASPTTHVSRDDPPFLIAHGARDRLVPLDQSRRLEARLEAASVPVRLQVYADAGHGGRAFGTPSHRDLVLAFFDRHLKGKAARPTPTVTAATGALATWSRKGRRDVATLARTVLRDTERGKDLQVRVTFPTGAGRFPVIVWSHGAYGSKDAYQPLARHWAEHGFVVIQATHFDSLALGRKPDPLSRLFAKFADRPKDVTFLLDHLDALRARLPGFEGTLDPAAVGVGGHSFGAHTSQLIGGVTTVGPADVRTSHRDARAKAVLLVSPQGRGGELDRRSFASLAVPMLTITGTRDGGRKGQDFTWRLDPFAHAPAGSKHAALIQGARHAFGGITGHEPSRRTGPAVPAHVDAVKALSLLFWRAYLLGDASAREVLASDRIARETQRAVRLVTR